MNGMLSVIIPAYNEEETVPEAAETISGILLDAGIPYELIFVDDGSKDRTWQCIERASSSENVRGIRFSRNFGKEPAMFAGLAGASGDCAAVIDCDMQHPPEKLVEMYRLWQEGYEVIEGVKEDRGRENIFHGLAAGFFNRIIGKAAGIDMSRASDFKLLDRRAVDALLSMKEKNVFFRALSSWVGFKTIQVPFTTGKRSGGESKWSLRMLIRYAVSNITSFTTAPMQIITFLGGVMLVVSVVLGVTALYQKITGTALEGFTTVIITELFIGSIVMISLGIIGYYIARIYEEVRDRPRYIIAETCGEQHTEPYKARTDKDALNDNRTAGGRDNV